MTNPETFPSNENNRNEQIDFFEVLDNVEPNENIIKIELAHNRELVIDSKKRGVFHIFDYISQTTAEVQYNRAGNLVEVVVSRMGQEAGDMENVWKKKHEENAQMVLKQFKSELGLNP